MTGLQKSSGLFRQGACHVGQRQPVTWDPIGCAAVGSAPGVCWCDVTAISCWSSTTTTKGSSRAEEETTDENKTNGLPTLSPCSDVFLNYLFLPRRNICFSVLSERNVSTSLFYGF